jgi:S-adenosylmethionine decarboxylase
MRDLAPDIVRQRLLIEGLYQREISRAEVERYLVEVAAHLGLRTYGSPMVHAPGGAGKADNEGFDAFIPLIDSGISLYVWSRRRFFAAVLFTCKAFDGKAAVDFTRDYFAATEIESRGF